MFWVTCFTDFESSIHFIHVANDSPSLLISWWKVRVTALSPPLRIVYNTVHLKPFLSTFHNPYERCGSSNSSLHSRHFFFRAFLLCGRRRRFFLSAIFPSPPPPRFFVWPQQLYLLLNEPKRKNSSKNCLLRGLVKQSQPLSSSVHDNAYSCRKFWALAETFHLLQVKICDVLDCFVFCWF